MQRRNWMIRTAAMSVGVLAMGSAMAAGNYSETETHVMRGISERQNTMNRFSTLALERGSTEFVRTFARRDIEEHTRLNDEVRELAKQIGIAGVGVGGPGAAGGPPGAGGPPPGGAPPAGAPGAGGPPPGGATGGAPRGGPAVYANRYQEQLKTLTGAAFDEMYLLRVLQYHEDLERTINGEIRDGVNPELIAWSKANIKTYELHARLVQRMLYGEVTSIPAEGALGTGGPGGGPPGAAPPR